MVKVKTQECFPYYFQRDDLTFICWQQKRKKKRFIENEDWVH